ncbi:hypothetical protein K438DRAFT_1989492 [Mycena galopus ATCC 62051]|nr:hypothetical protein K438DRAFT_1989492 [Mycena galopus ATCC 62051]
MCERIAALQLKEDRDREQRERATSTLPPSPHPNGGPAVVLPASASGGALRAKIAQFETKGPVPAPRGSFGMGAPPESAPKRRADGMLYGNRMQPARIPSATLGLARPTEAFSAVDPRAVPLPESQPGSPISPQMVAQHLDGLAHALSGSGRETPESLRPKVDDKKRIVQTRGTAFNTALDIARKAEAEIKAERRKSGHWLTPQHTGGALLPQFTGSSGLTAQYTGGTLTPQYTGGGKLTPQHTGSGLMPQYTGSSLTSGTLVPQLTGESTRSMSSPPLSPIGYSPRGFGSPGSASRREARLSLFSPSMSPPIEPLVLSEDDGPLSPRVLVDGPEHEGDGFVAEPAEEFEEERYRDSDEKEGELNEEPTSVPQTADEDTRLEESVEQEGPTENTPVEEQTSTPIIHAKSVDAPAPPINQAKETVHIPTPDSRQDDDHERQSIASINTHVSRAHSHSTHGSYDDTLSSPGSAHTGLDLDAHLHARAFPSHSYSYGHSPTPPEDQSRPSSVISVSVEGEAAEERSGFDDDDDDEGEEVLLPLSNTLHTHAFRAHLSTITERSWMEGGGSGSAAGSPPGARRGTDGSAFAPVVPGGRGGGVEPPGSAFVDGFADAGRERRRDNGVNGDANRFSVAGYDAASGAYGAYGSGAEVGTRAPPLPTGHNAGPTIWAPCAPGPPCRGRVPLGRIRQSERDAAELAQGSTITDSAVDASASTEFQTPSDAVIYSGVGSPYRLSGLTERGYTPSCGREEADPRTPTVQRHEEQQRDSLLSISSPQQDSLLPVAISNSQRDSLSSLTASQRDSLLTASQRNSLLSQRDSLPPSQRDSMSSIHTQTLSLRPLSVLSDLGSPSHVALAHRVPVAEQVAALGVARAMFIPSLMTGDPLSGNQLAGGGTEPDYAVSATQRAPAPHAALPTRTPAGAPPPRVHDRPPAAAYGVHPACPDSDEEGDVVGDFGTVSFGFGDTGKRNFRAVLERASGSQGLGSDGWEAGLSDEHPLPQTPMSPGFAGGDLAELLAEAAALEERLDRGELPGEALRRRSMRQSMRRPPQDPGALPPMPPIPAHGLGQAPLEPLRPTRSTSLKSLNPLSRSRSDKRKDKNKEEKRAGASSSMGNLLQMQDALISSPDPNAMTMSTSMPILTRSKSSSQYLTPIPASPSSINEVPPTPPPKSPSSRYFSSLRRLASTSRGLPGTGRTSLSSSEDSMGFPVTPDPYEGVVANTSSGQSTATSLQSNSSLNGSPHIGGIAWPALANKKSVGSLGKSAANFAGKMWHRSRSKSNTSTVSSLSEGASSPPPPMPSVPPLPPPPVLKLDAHSSTITPFVIPPIQTTSYEHDSPSSSPTSSTPVGVLPSSHLPQTAVPNAPVRTKSYPTSHTRPPALVLTTGNTAPSSTLLPVPKTAPESRPASWTSVSSNGSSATQSPLFDKAIFDAFPSVPEMPPPQPQSLPRLTPNRLNSPGGGASSLVGSAGPFPLESPPGYSASDTNVGSGSFGRDGLLTRLAETQRRVNLLP